MKRLLFVGELVAMLGALLGAPLWPTWFGRVALLMLPAVFILIAAVIRPGLFDARGLRPSRKSLGRYVHASAFGIGLGGWLALWAGYAGAEVDLIPVQHPRRVQIIYDVANGVPERRENGVRVLDLPSAGPLFTRASLRTGWSRDRDRRFFRVDALGRRTPANASPGSVGTMHQAAWGDCAADYTEYAVDGALDATEPTDSGDLGLHCVNGRLEIRSELLPQLPLGALGATALPQ